MHYWSESAGASVFFNQNRIGHIENLVFDPDKKAVVGFLLERRNRDIRYRFLPFIQIKDIKRDSLKIKDLSQIKALPKNAKKHYILTEDLLNRSIIDEKNEWVGRVVDFAFDSTNGFVREIIISGSLIDDLWYGRKRMPVLSNVEFSRELIQIDKDTREEITGLHKGLKNWLKMDLI